MYFDGFSDAGGTLPGGPSWKTLIFLIFLLFIRLKCWTKNVGFWSFFAGNVKNTYVFWLFFGGRLEGVQGLWGWICRVYRGDFSKGFQLKCWTKPLVFRVFLVKMLKTICILMIFRTPDEPCPVAQAENIDCPYVVVVVFSAKMLKHNCFF